MSSVKLQNPETSLAETRTATAQSIESEHITLHELFERIGEQGLGVALNRVPWLPARLMRTRIATAHLLPAMHKAAHLFARLDKLIRPRVLVLTHDAKVNRLNGFILVLCALLLMALIGLLPFSNTLPALAILLLAAGMLQRDGWFVLAGYGTMAATLAYFAALFGAALMAGHGIQTLISNRYGYYLMGITWRHLHG
jgi:hypothetical protein